MCFFAKWPSSFVTDCVDKVKSMSFSYIGDAWGDSTKNRFCDSPNDVSPEDAVDFFRLWEKTAALLAA